MEIYVYGLVGLFAGHLLVMYFFNNMEPEKKYCLHGRVDGIACPHCMGINREPEKKDVWKLENWEKKCPKCRRTLPDSFIKKLRTHFISRAEAVDKVKKIAYLSDDLGGGKAVSLDDLLDLLTQ